MNTMEKYLDALAAAVEAKDKESITLLEPFATHIYKAINARTEAACGAERDAWERMLQRVKGIVAGMIKAGPDLW
ncbi:MAG: hypothetical protein PHO83_01945 [Geobacteraceae bacterium]|nr:hypothetical protein [Geobacteraceae bacterium]